MKVLHTADWHVGKALQGRSRVAEHEAVLDEIAEIAARERAELILVAGDLFDTTSPSPEAERIVYRALLDLARIGRVVVIPGNHDNERRLAAVAPAFAPSDVTIKPFVESEPLRFESRAGEPVCLALLPWLSQRYIVRADQLMNKDADELGGAFRTRLERIISSLGSSFTPDSINLLMGHVTIAGGATGGGERAAQTIFDYWIDTNAFPASAHYVALGHLHKMQRLLGPCPVYYPGSPLALDFSDTADERYVLLVDADPSRPAEIVEIPLASGRRLRTISGTLAELSRQAGTTGDDYLRVRVEEPQRTGLGNAVRDLFPEAVKVIVSAENDATARVPRVRPDALPRDLFADYLDQSGIEDEAMLSLFQTLYEECA